MIDNTNHDEIEELLAGYALRGLEGDDAHEADRLLAEHVPTCDRCQDTLADFQALTGDLALAVAPVNPPDLLLPRLKSQLDAQPVKRRRPFAIWMSAAAMVAILALAAWNVLLTQQVSTTGANRDQLRSALNGFLSQDGSQMVSLKNDAQKPTMAAAYLPGQAHMKVVGVDVPQPSPGHVYELWFERDGQWVPAILFTPDSSGFVEFDVSADLSAYDLVEVTEEPVGSGQPAPDTQARWIAYPQG
jgi:hypothetical protein